MTNLAKDIYVELEEKLKDEIGKNGKDILKFNPIKLQWDDFVSCGDLINSENLSSVNRNYAFSSIYDLNKVTTPRGGLIGKIILKIKRRIFKFLMGILDPYFKEEREYQASVVRFLNETAKYIDKRDINQFLELIKKIDGEVLLLNTKIDEILDERGDDVEKVSDKFDLENKKIKSQIDNLNDNLQKLSCLVKSLEGIKLNRDINKVCVDNKGDGITPLFKNGDYLDFENHFRGSQDDIKERMRSYVDLIKNESADTQFVVEIGPGRGELLELLMQEKINAFGVEQDSAMCEFLKKKNLNFVNKDAISYLKEVPDESISSIVAIQVVEHLGISNLREFLKESYRALKKGGSILLETVNVSSLVTFSNNFYKDPTHKFPLHSDTLSYLTNIEGFSIKNVLKLSPYPKQSLFKEIAIDENVSPYLENYLEKYNENIGKLNDVLYGFQDYCVVAKK